MSRMRFKSIGALALAAGLLTVGATAPAFADHGEGGEGGIEPISISITAACDSEQQGVQVDAEFGLFGTSIAGVIIDGASVYEEGLDSGHVGQDGISTFLPLEDGTYAVSVYVASQENVVSDQVTITLPTEEGCVTEEPEPTPPSVASITASVECVDDASVATVNVNVAFPAGNPAASLDVLYGEEQKLSATQTVTQSGLFSFSGSVPLGETYFAIVLNGFNVGTAKVVAEACDTDEGTTPPPVTKPNAPVSNPEPPAAAPQKPVVQAPPAAKPAPVVPEYNSVPVPATGDTLTAASQSSGLAPIGFAALLFAGIAGVLLTRRRLASNR